MFKTRYTNVDNHDLTIYQVEFSPHCALFLSMITIVCYIYRALSIYVKKKLKALYNRNYMYWIKKLIHIHTQIYINIYIYNYIIRMSGYEYF